MTTFLCNAQYGADALESNFVYRLADDLSMFGVLQLSGRSEFNNYDTQVKIAHRMIPKSSKHLQVLSGRRQLFLRYGDVEW